MKATETDFLEPGAGLRVRAPKRKRFRGLGGVIPPVPLDDDAYQDRIARAVGREREHRRVAFPTPECETVWAHVFTCVCCGRLRGEQERRDASSEVCVRCVREAGYEN
jgi:hypothetical protein